MHNKAISESQKESEKSELKMLCKWEECWIACKSTYVLVLVAYRKAESREHNGMWIYKRWRKIERSREIHNHFKRSRNSRCLSWVLLLYQQDNKKTHTQTRYFLLFYAYFVVASKQRWVSKKREKKYRWWFFFFWWTFGIRNELVFFNCIHAFWRWYWVIEILRFVNVNCEHWIRCSNFHKF